MKKRTEGAVVEETADELLNRAIAAYRAAGGESAPDASAAVEAPLPPPPPPPAPPALQGKHESTAVLEMIDKLDKPLFNRFVMIPLMSKISGYTQNAIRMKMREGVWLEKREWFRAPDDRIVIDREAVDVWMKRGK